MIRYGSFLLLSLALVNGCATAYTPRPGPRLSVVMESGAPVYVRDSQRFEHGMFGSGLVEAVQGVPEAEEYARTYRDRNVAGFTTSIVGAGMIGVGSVMTAEAFVSDRSSTDRGIALGLLVGGVVVELIGSIIAASGNPHQLDAINAYNDAIEAEKAQSLPDAPPAAPEVVVE